MYQQIFGLARSSLQSLSTDELKEFLNDDEQLEQFISFDILEQDKRIIFAQNRKIAEENVNREPEIIERKTRISELSERGKTLCSSVQSKLKDLGTKNGDKTPDTALALLQTSAAECEEKSENIAKDFQEKIKGIDEFLEQFMSERRNFHLRKLKSEKMVEILRKDNQVFS